eukprot:COSAG01_NODE_11556_length_1904_cov_1.498615_1_plen_472_part_00
MDSWGSKKVQMYLQLGRDWAQVEVFWASVVAGHRSLESLMERVAWQRGACPPLPLPPLSPEGAGKALTAGACGRIPRIWRVTMAYYGPGFQGWAWQPQGEHHSVEGALQSALTPLCAGQRPRIHCAGRTDAGVSAAGQVFSFVSYDGAVTPEHVLAHINGCSDGAAAAAAAREQPSAETGAVVTAVSAAQPAQSKGQARKRRREARVAAAATLVRLRAYDAVDNTGAGRGSSNGGGSFHATRDARWRRYVYLLPRRHTGRPSARGVIDAPDVDAATIDRLLRRLEGRRLDCTALARANRRQVGEESVCTFFRCRAGTVHLPYLSSDSNGGADSNSGGGGARGSDDDKQCGSGGETECVVIELVADRFLRQLVRVLVATVAREAAKLLESTVPAPTKSGVDGSEPRFSDACASCESVLRLLLAEGESKAHAPTVAELRAQTAPPAPASGLCLASVGYSASAAAEQHENGVSP